MQTEQNKRIQYCWISLGIMAWKKMTLGSNKCFQVSKMQCKNNQWVCYLHILLQAKVVALFHCHRWDQVIATSHISCFALAWWRLCIGIKYYTSDVPIYYVYVRARLHMCICMHEYMYACMYAYNTFTSKIKGATCICM